MDGRRLQTSIEELIEWCKITKHEIDKREKEYKKKLIEDVKKALERGATKPSPCKKSWRGRFNSDKKD